MRNLSLNLRLCLLFTLTTVTIFGISAYISFIETKENIDEFFDTYQTVLARQLAAADWNGVKDGKHNHNFELLDELKGGEADDEAIGFAIFEQSGKLVFHDNENGKHFPFTKELKRFSNQRLDDDDKWRLLSIKTEDGNYIVTVGQELEFREDMAFDILEEFMAPWFAGFIFLIIVLILLTWKEFRPLRKLASTIAKRQGDDFSKIDTQQAPSEIRPLLSAMNLMLEKIETLREKEQSFIADSAHELRTPLTALKVQLEVAQMSEHNETLRKTALDKLGSGIERAAHLVEQLLALSRVDANSSLYSCNEPILWEKIIENLVLDYKDAAKAKDITFALRLKGNGPFERGNPMFATLLVRNLIDNAVKYSPQGAVIQITLKAKKLCVTNSGVTVDDAVLLRLSERFFRPAGQKENGSGLGLAIAKKIASLYGTDIAYSNVKSGFRVCVLKKADNF